VKYFCFEQITGQKVPETVRHDLYKGQGFGMKDSQRGDIAGTQKFSGLESAVFPASDLKDEEQKPEQAAVGEKP
jgi:hypothetical protein